MEAGAIFSTEAIEDSESSNVTTVKYSGVGAINSTDMKIDNTTLSNDDQIVYQGWLDKRGEYIQNWRKRYFICWLIEISILIFKKVT